MELVSIWWRAFSIVTLTALNVTQVSGHHYVSAFFTGSALSFVWWGNTQRAAADTSRLAPFAYSFGAGCGTLCGMWLGGWIG